MNSLKNKESFYLGAWLVTPNQNKLKNLEEEIFIEPKLMEVLSYLCLNAPEIMSIDNIIKNCWPNQFISDNPLHKCIAQLRKILGDSIKNPQYIKTISKKGYSIVADIKGIKLSTSANIASWHNNVPYLGLRPYGVEQKTIFFGRSKAFAEIKSLVDKIMDDKWPLLVISGLSSVGKTSLINTKLIPYLETPDKPFKYNYVNPLRYDFALNTDPDRCCVQSFLKYLIKIKVFNDWLDSNKYLQQLNQSLSDSKTLDTCMTPSQFKQKHHSNQQILFIDHFEKISSKQKNNSKELNLILLIILQLLKTNDYFIIIASRSENYQALNDSIVYQAINQKILYYELLPPNIFEIAEIVQKPIIAAGLRYQFNTSTFESLDKVIVDDARNMGNILPILNHTLKELSENCDDKRQLTFEIYHKIGKLTGALTYKIENILATLSDHEKTLLANNLHHLIQYNPGMKKEYHAHKTNSQLFKSDKLKKLINYLIDNGMLQSQQIKSQTYVSILHDSLLQECHFFKQWIAKNHLVLSIATEVKTLADQWLSSNKNSDYLLSNNYLLEQTNNLIRKDKIDFNSGHNQFLKLSRQKQNTKTKLKFTSVILLITLLIFSLVLLLINRQTSAELIKTNNSAETLITSMIGDLKDKLRPLGKLELLEIVGKQIINYYNNRSQSLQSEQSLLQYNKALNTIGEVEVNQGKLVSAERIFKQAVKNELSSFETDESKISAFFSYSQSYYWLGYIYYLQNNFELTQKYWSLYLDLSEQLLNRQPENQTWKLEKSYALNNLGSLNYELGNLLIAERYFNTSAQLKKDILSHDPNNTTNIIELADTISWQANIFDKRNELIQSNKIYTQSLNLIEKLVFIDNENKIWQHNLALAYYRQASSHYDLGELIKVKNYLIKALAIYVNLHKFDNTNQIWVDELINCYILISKVYRHMQDLDNASLHLKKGITVYNTYNTDRKDLKSTHVQNLYLNAEINLIALFLGQNKTAANQFSQTIEQFNSIDSSKYQNINFLKAYMNFVMAKILSANQRHEQASVLLTKAITLLNNDITTTKEKKNMALYIALEKAIGQKNHTSRLTTYLQKINYKNPDFTK